MKANSNQLNVATSIKPKHQSTSEYLVTLVPFNYHSSFFISLYVIFLFFDAQIVLFLG